MLLLNGEQFVPSAKNPDTAIQRAHYQESIAAIKEKYGQGGRNKMISLVRRKEPVRNATGLLEETAPIVFPAKAYSEIQFSFKDEKLRDKLGGSMEEWAYSKNRPKRPKSGDPFQPDPKSLKFMSYMEGYNMDSEMDLLYFLLYKSPRVYYQPAIAQGKAKKGDFIVDDRAQRAKDKITKERNELRLKNAIMAPEVAYPLHSDENLRKVAAAWGIDGAMDIYASPDELRITLEHRVMEGEKNKKKNGKGRGYDEFFDDIKFDDSIRSRTMIMYALDSGKVSYNESKQEYEYSNGSALLAIPDNRRGTAFDYLADYLGNEVNTKHWERFKKEVISVDYLEMVAYGDLKWLAKQDDIAISQKNAETLKEDISKVYCG